MSFSPWSGIEEPLPPPAEMSPGIVEPVRVVLGNLPPRIHLRKQHVAGSVKGQQFIGTLDQGEHPVRRCGAAVMIRMVLKCRDSVGSPELLLAGVFSDLENAASCRPGRQIEADPRHEIGVVSHRAAILSLTCS